MNDRFTIKIAGAAGQGIKSSGQIISKAVKRSGYFTFGYTEYPSLIKGGHNVFQIEVSDRPVASVSKDTDVLMPLNRESVDLHINEFDKDGGIIILDKTMVLTPEQQARVNELKIKVFTVGLLEIAMGAGGNAIMKNTVAMGAIWKTLGLDVTNLLDVIAEIFAHKGEEVININKKAAQGGFDAITETFEHLTSRFKSNPGVRDHIIIGGNEALALGAIASGVKMYSSYPMTPASSILTALAEWAPKSGMLIKQAEDEITAANMCVGAAFAGIRALCGTSGGGLDLMSETISLAGITETPFVVILGQRPGPGTGVPTWTAQGDLNMAINTAHGEFPRIVMSISDSEDAFYLMGDAFNLAEKFQVPVLLLTEKTSGESFYTIKEYDQSKITIDRGKLIPSEQMTGNELRYAESEDGVSPRWFPGQHGTARESLVHSTFVANSDEHDGKGYSTEDAPVIKGQIEKRMRKLDGIKAALPEPLFYGDENPDVIFVTWGSNKRTLEDAAAVLREQGKKIKIMHFTYLWPLKTDTLNMIKDQLDKVYIVEQNFQAQLAELIKKETGINIKNRILRYDSKPFYVEDIIDIINGSK